MAHPIFRRIAIDFDKVLNSYEGYKREELGPPIKGSKKALEEFKDKGYQIYVFTARPELGDIKRWLDKHDFPKMTVTNRKIPSDLYIDDRAYRFKNWSENELGKMKNLLGAV